ncbi:glucokinase [Paludibacterium yongneupense]|uniref:glucokinase n=1 Tax=Paludibacterium yongneupense TaxID=400061 RepID=UPI000405317E|nr:glucokinase [Paludibacterium yongneupense]
MSLEPSYPRLLADIGGTNARFALETSAGVLEKIEVLPGADYPTLEAALRTYLQGAGAGGKVRHAAIGIANPVTGDWVQMTNHHWGFSIEATRLAAGLDTLVVINDFTALALSLPHLPADELRQVGGGSARPNAVMGLIGPGTGLGVSGLIPDGAGAYTALAGEGGHVSFAPFDERELAVWRFARERHEHVSAERLLSGPGLVLIHEALCHLAGEAYMPATAAEVTRRALEGESVRCREAVEVFCAMLGGAAGNLALTLGSVGGVYIGGGIVPRLGELFLSSPFRSRFEDKGRFSGYLAAIPVFLIESRYPALIGAGAALSARLGKVQHA